ncbi:MAG TPA: class I SAM-dependent methyltransferase [Anaerolineales bacterium]|jgi:magnesium-protoporphyrin O-methyltransferase
MPCDCCEITDNAFTEDEARADMNRYHKRGPANQTRLILEAIRSFGFKDATLLDIGGGIGAIHHELLPDTAAHAIHVDASAAYLKEARAETERRGHTAQVEFRHADFTDVADDLPQTDLVTLDRVVCCYPDFRGLLEAAAGRSRAVVALTYPREIWYMRVALAVMNLLQRMRRDPFRVFLHPVAEMDELLTGEGFSQMSLRRLWVWEAALYYRKS